MSLPRVVAVQPDSPAALAGVHVGDVVMSIDGEQPRDIIRYQYLVDVADPTLEVDRGGLVRSVEVSKSEGEPLGIEVHSALFDQVRTCDNRCPFCFIHQLPPGMRSSLSVKDDDFRLSFLYGNFTTLTRFTEADLERVITEGLSPLYVSIHSTDPELRNRLLRNRRGGPSLRWLRALLDHGIEVHGQVVVCPGLNDGAALDRTLADVAIDYPELATLAVVPLGVSDHSTEPELRPHSTTEAAAVIDLVEGWQEIYRQTVGRRLAFAADEYYLLAEREPPPAEHYGDFPMYEDGIGMIRAFEAEFRSARSVVGGASAGFFASVDGAPAAGYRAPRLDPGSMPLTISPRRNAPLAILTGTYGAKVVRPLVAEWERTVTGTAPDVRVVEVPNHFFGGNIGVAGLLVGADLQRVLADEPPGHRYLLPDVCLSSGVFLDGLTPADLPRPVQIIPADGAELRRVLDDCRSTLDAPASRAVTDDEAAGRALARTDAVQPDTVRGAARRTDGVQR